MVTYKPTSTLFIIILSSLVGMVGCQKSNETENSSDVQVTKITSNSGLEASEKSANDTVNTTDPNAEKTTTDANSIDGSDSNSHNSTDGIDSSPPANHSNDFEVIDGVIVAKGSTTEAAQATNNPNVTDSTASKASKDSHLDKNSHLENNDSLEAQRPLSVEEQRALTEKQITDVEYQSLTGEVIRVTFQTSALAELEADVMLPSGQRVILTAPQGQGNNPIYQSRDGKIKLVTHGGGGSIDLLYNGKQINFDAISAEAEVISSS